VLLTGAQNPPNATKLAKLCVLHCLVQSLPQKILTLKQRRLSTGAI